MTEFNEQYYCPTALDLPTLDYVDEDTGKKVQMVIVGDPTEAGPNFLDAGLRSNCAILLAPQPAKHQKTLPSGKIAVASSLLQLRVKHGLTLCPADELFFAYENGARRTFWAALPSNAEHCATCFSRAHMDPENVLIQCEGDGGTCPVSRHRKCFTPVPSVLAVASARFFCPEHLHAVHLLSVLPLPADACSAADACFSPTKVGIYSEIFQPRASRPLSPPPASSRFLPPPERGSPDFALYFAHRDSLSSALQPSALSSRLDDSALAPAPRLRRLAAVPAARSCPPKHNLPLENHPSAAGVLRQTYDLDDANCGLERNCAFLNTVRIPSSLGEHAGHGLAVQRATLPSTLVGYMFGYFITRDQWNIIRAGGPAATALCGSNTEMQHHVEMAQSGVWWCLETEMVCDELEEYLLLVSPQCPMGWINDPQDASQINVEMRAPTACVQSSDGLLDYWLFPLFSTRALRCMEELFLDYGWSAADWRRAKQLHAAYMRDRMSDEEASKSPSTASSDSSFESEAEVSTARGRRFSALGSVRHHAGPCSLGDDSQSTVTALPIRKKQAIEKLPGWMQNLAQFGQVTAPLRELIISTVNVHQGLWFAPPLKASKAAPLLSVSADQVSTNSTDLWCKIEQIGRDFAEYKSCCGAEEVVCAHLARMPSAQMKLHSSLSLLNMMKARVKHRANVVSRDQFSSWVQAQLEDAVQARVAWQGDSVCCSCFRALLGVSRSSVHSWRNKVDKEQQRSMQITPAGQLRRAKPAPKLQDATDAVGKYIEHFGQAMPTSRSKNPDEELVVVPAKGQTQLLEQVLHFYAQSNSGHQQRFARSTLWRALKAIRKDTGVIVSATKSKMICRCDDCELLDRALEALPSTEKRRRLEISTQKQRHLQQVMEQRKHFDDLKATAISSPLKLWVLAFDGMDQAKTQLPSVTRFAKGTDGLPRLGVHAVGAFMFGGPVPVMGLLNYEDLRKDASLSITTVMNILERQWAALLKQAGPERDQPPSDSGAGSTSDGEVADPDAMDEGENELYERPQSDGRRTRAKRRAARVVTPAMQQFAASHWPERLHLTFDNAVGEAKNQYMFRFLGLLVLFNIFHTITVSTLLVGHTHDIVDQMFSVWARILRVNDAATYERMRALFRDKYHSKIKGLIALMRGGHRGEAEVEEAAVALGDEAVNDVIAARATEDDDIMIDQLAAAELEKLASELQLDRGIKPVITLQTFNINVKAWMARAKGTKGQHGADEQPLRHIAVPHVFGIEKDGDGDVWLYNKFLVKSDKVKNDGAKHHCPDKKTGTYSTRVLLHKAANAAFFNFDPDVWPARPVDADSLRKTFNAFEANNSIDAQQKSRLTRTLDMFKRRQRKQLAQCAVCKDLLQEVHSIGVVSRKPTSTDAEKAEATAKSTRRTQAQTALEKHLTEVAHPALHKKTKGWFTNWSNVRASFIVASYVERGILLAEELRDVPYHIHPRFLCEGQGEEPVFEAHGRVDSRCLASRGPPAKDQLIIVRASDPNEAFWIGRIVKINESLVRCGPQLLSPNFWGGELENELGVKYSETGAKLLAGKERPFEIRMSHVVPTALNEPTQLGAFFNRDVAAGEFLDFFARCLVDKDAVLGNEHSHVRRVNNVSKVLDGGPLARCFVRYIATDDAGLARMRALPASAFLPTREELGDLQYSRFLQMAAGCMINSPKLSEKQANVSMSGRLELGAHLSHAAVAKVTAIRDARKGEELLGWYRSEEERHMERQRDASFALPSAASVTAAAANDERKDPFASASHSADAERMQSFGRAHVSDRNAVITSMEALPSVTVKWLDIHPQDYERLKLADQAYWSKLHDKHPTQAAPTAADARITKPEWLVNQFEGTRYSESYTSKDQNKDVATLLPSSFIYWGERAAILTEKNKLVKSIWKLVREDLTERRVESAKTKPAAARSKAAMPAQRKRRKAAAAAAEAATVELEIQARRPSSSRAAAASATAANRAAVAAESASESEPDAISSSNFSSSNSSDESEDLPLSFFAPRQDVASRQEPEGAAAAASAQGKRPRSESDDDASPSLPRPATRAGASRATRASVSKKRTRAAQKG